MAGLRVSEGDTSGLGIALMSVVMKPGRQTDAERHESDDHNSERVGAGWRGDGSAVPVT